MNQIFKRPSTSALTPVLRAIVGAFRPHGTQLVGVARCGVDEDETINHVRPGGREMLRDKAAKRNSCDMRASNLVPGKQFGKLSR